MHIKTARVAVFKNVGCRYETVADDSLDKSTSYVRLSEYEEVTFVPRKLDDTVGEEVTRLDQLKVSVTKEFHDKLLVIEQQRSNLLALSYDPPTDDDVPF